jgi:replicative DNA helicase
MLDGMKPERLYVLAARPSHGKSALALNVAAFASVDAGIPSRYVSLEMGRDELAERYLAGAASVDGTYIRKGKLTRDDYLMLEVAAENADARAAMVIDDEPSQTLFAIGARARRQKARHGLGLLVIDYLQLIDGQPRKGESREQEVSRISRRLKSLAKELKIPVLACCQVNRLAEAREDRRPRVADLRESGSIEQDADVVMLLHRPEQHDPNDRAGEAELVVAKHRGGPTGTVKLAFDKRYTRFAALAQRIEPPVDYGDEPF